MRVPPIAASYLCLKPRGLMTRQELATTTELKRAVRSSGDRFRSYGDDFCRRLYFRGAFQSGRYAGSLVAWEVRDQGCSAVALLHPATAPALLAEFLFTFALVYVVPNVATAKGTSGNSFTGWQSDSRCWWGRFLSATFPAEPSTQRLPSASRYGAVFLAEYLDLPAS
jgi:hypothetical protein